MLRTALASIFDEVGVVVLDKVRGSVLDDFVVSVGDEFGVDGWGVGRPRDPKVEDSGIQRHPGVVAQVVTQISLAPQLFPCRWPQGEIPTAFCLAVRPFHTFFESTAGGGGFTLFSCMD